LNLAFYKLRMNNTCRINLLLAFVVILLPFGALSYPLYIRIDNPRAHPLFIHSPLETMTIEIAAEGSREFLVCCQSDFRVQYASGASGIFAYNLDETLNTFIDGCKKSMGDNWEKKTIKYCAFRLEEKKAHLASTTYTLTVTEVKDLGIPFDSEQCKFSLNEKALKVTPFSKTHELLTPEIKATTTIIFKL